MKKGKKLYAVIAACVCGTVIAGSVGWYFINVSAKETEKSYREVTLEHGDLPLTFTREGTTAEGNIEQSVAFDTAETDITVEECYVQSGDEVKTGDALYKISEESLEEAKTYYEEAVADAAKAADTAKSAYEAGKAKAEYTKSETETTADLAKENYDADNSSLDQKVTQAEAELNEAKSTISMYQTNLDQNTYYTDAGVTEKQESYQAAQKVTKQAQTADTDAKSSYEQAYAAVSGKIQDLQTAVSSSAESNTTTQMVTELSALNQTLAEKKSAVTEAESNYQSAVEAEEKAKEAYNSANTSYEKAVSDATARKESLEKSLSSLEQAYTDAVNAAATGKIDNQNTYDTAVLEGEYADVTYKDTVSTLKTAYDEAADTLADLKEEQSALLALDKGTITAEYDGTIASVSYDAGDILNSDLSLVSYSDTDKLSVAVEVLQEDIAKIAVGDTVSIRTMSGRADSNNIEGTITSIAAEATSSGSMSNVTYTVTVTFDNSGGELTANTSAYVTFTYGELSDVDYIQTDALDNINDDFATVKTYDKNQAVVETKVTIAESTDRYTVITDGITADTVCLIEAGGKPDEKAEQ